MVLGCNAPLPGSPPRVPTYAAPPVFPHLGYGHHTSHLNGLVFIRLLSRPVGPGGLSVITGRTYIELN